MKNDKVRIPEIGRRHAPKKGRGASFYKPKKTVNPNGEIPYRDFKRKYLGLRVLLPNSEASERAAQVTGKVVIKTGEGDERKLTAAQAINHYRRRRYAVIGGVVGAIVLFKMGNPFNNESSSASTEVVTTTTVVQTDTASEGATTTVRVLQTAPEGRSTGSSVVRLVPRTDAPAAANVPTTTATVESSAPATVATARNEMFISDNGLTVCTGPAVEISWDSAIRERRVPFVAAETVTGEPWPQSTADFGGALVPEIELYSARLGVPTNLRALSGVALFPLGCGDSVNNQANSRR